MSEQPEEPNWELLPERPAEFFGLRGEYDRVDLKRAYNLLLRRFKPERFPEEFKRIRAAFEQVEEWLRWSGQQGGATQGADLEEGLVTRLPTPDALKHEALGLSAQPPKFDTLKRLARDPLPQVLEDLRAHGEKSPQNWCQLALMEEELDPQNPLALFETLIAGARATKFSPGVMHLLIEACEEPLDPLPTVELLTLLAQLLRDKQGRLDADRYYYITDTLWLRLATRVPFKEFSALLSETRASVSEESGGPYLHLLIRAVAQAGLQADDEWFDETLAYIEERYHDMSSWMQHQVVQIDWLVQYRAERGEFLDGSEARRQVDEVLVLYARGKRRAAVRAMSWLFTGIRERPKRALDAFDIQSKASFANALHPLWWIAEECADELGGRRDAQGHQALNAEVTGFAWLLERQTDQSLLGILWNLLALGWMLVLLTIFAALPLILMARWLFDQPLLLVGLVIGWCTLLMYLWAGDSRLKSMFSYPAGRLSLWFSRALYLQSWRWQTVLFLAKTHMTTSTLKAYLGTIEEDGITNCELLLQLLEEDEGLSLYSLALQFEDLG